jgi:hypothetical protein
MRRPNLHASTTDVHLKEHDMNILKHMEAVFLATLATAGAAAVAVDSVAPDQAHAVTVATRPASATSMAVVHVTAKRLHPSGKRLAMMRDTPARRA